MRRVDALFAAFALLAAGAADAGPATAAVASEEINVVSDHGELDRRAGRARYWGNVTITQGTTRITADEVLLEAVDGELVSATINGRPATFEQTPPGASEPTRGSARRMTLLAAEEIIELREDARITQGGDEVAGELIRYDVKRQQVVSAGQVKMTLTPRKAKEPAREPPAEDRK